MLDGSRLKVQAAVWRQIDLRLGIGARVPCRVYWQQRHFVLEEAAKGAQFIQLCNRTNTPLVFLHNITGFMVGSQAERGGIIRNGAKLISSVEF